MNQPDITSTSIDEQSSVAPRPPVPVLLVAHSPSNAATWDRCRIRHDFSVGRNPDNHLSLPDQKMSGHHFCLKIFQEDWVIEDLGSTNGTYVNGKRQTGTSVLSDNDLIRAGHTIFVFHRDGEELLQPPPLERYGTAGRFFVAKILKSLEEAALSKRHLLIVGPSGTGKELAAEAVSRMIGDRDKPVPFVAHNAARFTSEEEATSTLFGVGARAFSNVAARPGLIERAEGGVLFLDEIHNLTERVQRSLLRVIEDRQFSRIGETGQKAADVRFVMASNSDGPMASMAHDLYARLRLVNMPSLRERRADIPSIFDFVLSKKLSTYNIPESSVLLCLKGEHYELLCLDGFENDNVRGLIDIADRIATKIAAGTTAHDAVSAVFVERYPTAKKPGIYRTQEMYPIPLPAANEATIEETDDAGASSTYEKFKDVIIATYRDREENISATMRVLNARGIPCSRRWLAVYLQKWGLK